jgi:hypothetical protein
VTMLSDAKTRLYGPCRTSPAVGVITSTPGVSCTNWLVAPAAIGHSPNSADSPLGTACHVSVAPSLREPVVDSLKRGLSSAQAPQRYRAGRIIPLAHMPPSQTRAHLCEKNGVPRDGGMTRRHGGETNLIEARRDAVVMRVRGSRTDPPVPRQTQRPGTAMSSPS